MCTYYSNSLYPEQSILLKDSQKKSRDRIKRPIEASMDAYDSDQPLFCDDTGEALNDAARKLVLSALAEDKRAEVQGDVKALGNILGSIPVVDCAVGKHKYVQVQMTHPEEPDTFVLVVRSYDHCNYHAENYQELMRRLRRDPKTKGCVGRVIGGGRIRFDKEAGACEVYGYSKTFGRTPGCNEKTADIIRKNCLEFKRVDWSDSGY